MLLTARQSAVLEYIKKHVANNSFPPTVREVAAHFGFASPLSAQLHIDALVKKGFLKKSRFKQRTIEVLEFKPARGIKIPLLKKINAGSPALVAEHIDDYINVDSGLFNATGGFAIKVPGDSMIDIGIFKGDIALINPGMAINDGEIAVVLIGDKTELKRFYRDRNRIRLMSENRSIKPITLHLEYINIAGKVVGILRKF